MRVIVFGAGAVGGMIGARLFQQEHDVTFVARGENYRALSANGIRIEVPDGIVILRVPVVEDVVALSFGTEDLVLLTVKSQDTKHALQELASRAHPATAIVCAQNGVENERVALRLFGNVYGMCVKCLATHLTPGVVQVGSSPINGILDLGRWPQGVDERASKFAAALSESSFESVARSDISRWKWGKLLRNLGNAVEAVCDVQGRTGILTERAVQEGVEVLKAAGIKYVDDEEDMNRRGQSLNVGYVGGVVHTGGSSWQSLVRAAGTIETDYLTGEIVLQGRLHGVDTPVNELLQRLANRLALERRAPAAWTEREILAMLEDK